VVSIDSTLFFEIVLLIVLVLVLDRLLYRPVLAVMKERQEKLGNQHNTIAVADAENREILLFIDQTTRATRDQAKLKSLEAEQQSETEGRIEISRANDNAEKQMKLFRDDMQAAIQKARLEIQPELKSFTSEILKKILPLIVMIGLASMPALGSEAHSGNTEESHSGGGMNEIARVVNFSLLAIALYYIGRNPISSALKNRSEGIKKSFDTAAEKLESLQLSIRRNHEEKKSLEESSLTILDKAEKEALLLRMQLRKANQEAVHQIQDNTGKQQAFEEEKSLQELRFYSVEQAIRNVEAQLEKGIDVETDKRLVEQFLGQIEENDLRGFHHA
jgi:F-type H+-transporting ATPase subunit b